MSSVTKRQPKAKQQRKDDVNLVKAIHKRDEKKYIAEEDKIHKKPSNFVNILPILCILY